MTPTPLFDSPDSLAREIDAEVKRPWSRYGPPEDIASSRHRGSEESELANELVSPIKAALRAEVLDFIRSRGAQGATTEEIAKALGLRIHSVSGRVSELRRDGLAVKSGRHRATSSGSPAAVIVCSEFQE